MVIGGKNKKTANQRCAIYVLSLVVITVDDCALEKGEPQSSITAHFDPATA